MPSTRDAATGKGGGRGISTRASTVVDPTRKSIDEMLSDQNCDIKSAEDGYNYLATKNHIDGESQVTKDDIIRTLLP